ncbi:MAG: hypothetical protein HZB73_02510, partial [Nitrosarchaeum sp.]|nr:hypothetical protein [Nitrosarchaeum sp.]
MNILATLVLLSICLSVLNFGSAFGSDYTDYNPQNLPLHHKTEDKVIDEFLSWNIEDRHDFKFSDSLTVYHDLENFIHFDGKYDFMLFKSNKNGTMSKISILVFVKPHFNNANNMTVIEQKDSFSLTLNNNDGYHAEFSIFDGNQWISISSPVILKEEWTSIFVEFDGSSIKLLVNDVNLVEKQLDITNPIFGRYDNLLHSDHEIVLGASKSTGGFSDFYSGDIDEVQLYTNKITENFSGKTLDTFENTSLQLSNQTSVTPTNQTSVTPTNQTSVTPTNQTSVTPTNQTSVTPTNQTSMAPVETIPPQIIEDFKLDNSDNVEILGKIKSENKSEVVFDGTQMIKKDGDSTKKLVHFTISSWVKPDYDKGSSDFTIISKEKTFALGIHNIIPPPKTAWFTVFDGIESNLVTSSTGIGEEWTNVVATYDGSKIKLYVNGNLENTLDVSIPYFTIYGKFIEIPLSSLESDSDLTVGGTHQHIADAHEIKDLYSGKINQIVLLNSTLTDDQISAEYAKDLPQYQSLDKELSIEELTEIIRQEQNQTGASITSQNYTSPEILEPAVSPQLVPVDGNFMITEDAELHLEFYSKSDSLLKELFELDSATTSLLVETQQIIDSIDADSTISPNPLGFLFELERLIPNADGAQPNDIETLKTSLTSLQSKLSNLKSKIEELKTMENLNINDIKELKAQLKETISEIKLIASQLEKSNLKSQGADLKSSADSAEKTNDLLTPEKQRGKWKDNDGEINTKVLDSHGNPVNLYVSYEKLVDGKFNLRISPNSDTKPGIYKIVSTILVNGEEHTVESQFAWGLVSLNTKKSIYHPNETAEFVIVVLDSQGHPVCDANLSMSITDPNSGSTLLTTG